MKVPNPKCLDSGHCCINKAWKEFKHWINTLYYFYFHKCTLSTSLNVLQCCASRQCESARSKKGNWEATGKKRRFLSASFNFYKKDSMLSRSEINNEHFTQKHTGIGRSLVQLSCLSDRPLPLLRTDKCTGFHIQFNCHPVTHCTTAGATSCGKIFKKWWILRKHVWEKHLFLYLDWNVSHQLRQVGDSSYRTFLRYLLLEWLNSISIY